MRKRKRKLPDPTLCLLPKQIQSSKTLIATIMKIKTKLIVNECASVVCESQYSIIRVYVLVIIVSKG